MRYLFISTCIEIFPLSSCSCERSASALRRLKNYLRCLQTEERFSALALVHCNYETQDVNSVCKLHLEKRPRRIVSQLECFNWRKIVHECYVYCEKYQEII